MGLGVGVRGFVNPAPSGVRTPDHPAHSESLYYFMWDNKVKVKVTLEQATKAQKGE